MGDKGVAGVEEIALRAFLEQPHGLLVVA